MRIFLAGIIQGSHAGTELHAQDYRDEIKQIVGAHLPEATVTCPMDLHPDGIAYGPADIRHAFFSLVKQAASADVLVAYLPEASLGTAIEIWEAYHAGRPVVTITPMRHNWVVNLLSEQVCYSLAEFGEFVAEGGLAKVAEVAAAKRAATPLPPRGEHCE
ncbi:MAG: hypothetical protein ACYC1C_19970 [Chloroflexota bacterium]